MYYIRLYSYIVLYVFTLHIVSYFLVILYDYFASVEMFLIAYTVGCSGTVSFSCASRMIVMYTDIKHNINGKLTTENIREFFHMQEYSFQLIPVYNLLQFIA